MGPDPSFGVGRAGFWTQVMDTPNESEAVRKALQMIDSTVTRARSQTGYAMECRR
jgi:hypothetical protein